jgi:hypothetical protein
MIRNFQRNYKSRKLHRHKQTPGKPSIDVGNIVNEKSGSMMYLVDDSAINTSRASDKLPASYTSGIGIIIT